MARALRLNEDLTEAIGLGHDLGHSPFGHTGEEALDRCLSERWGGHFRHYEQSLRIVERLERDGRGLNLTEQVRDGIAHHSGRAAMPSTLEGRIVRIVDRVAYINHDIDDALRAGVIDEGTCRPRPWRCLVQPEPSGSTRSSTTSSRTATSQGTSCRERTMGASDDRLREFMFERVYLGPEAKREHARIETVISTLFDWYSDDTDRIPSGASPGDATDAERVTDWIAGMTDRFCIRAFEDVAMPEAFAP